MAARNRTALWSPEALRDLDEIWNYYERAAGAGSAEKIVRSIGNVIALLEDHPYAGRSRDELRPGIRSLAATAHVIFYRVRDERPEIVRILDTRRDIEEVFAD